MASPGPIPDFDMHDIPRQFITADGRILIQPEGQLALWGPGETTFIATEESARSAIVNDAGTLVVYESRDESTGEHQLRAVAAASGGEVVLASGSPDGYHFTVANDGGSVLYYIKGAEALHVASPDPLAEPRAFEVPDGVREAVLSGSGQVAWVTTNAGRIVRFDIATGDAREVVGRTPFLQPVYATSAPGSLVSLVGSGLSAVAEVATPPLPKELGGVRVELDGVPAPLWSVSPNRILLQVPFEGDFERAIDVAAPQWQFDTQHRVLRLAVAKPEFYRDPLDPGLARGAVIAVHSDFSALVSEDNPASPGEIVHFYMTGLGPVDPELPIGEAAPLDRFHRVSGTFRCRTASTTGFTPLEVLFAGLAPGMVGIYQVSLRMPASFSDALEPNRGRLVLNCGMPPHNWAGAGVWVELP